MFVKNATFKTLNHYLVAKNSYFRQYPNIRFLQNIK